MGFMGAMGAMGSTANRVGSALTGRPSSGGGGGNMGGMVRSAMNPAQQMRGLGPSGPPAQRFSGMQGPNKQRSPMGPMMGPMQQAGQMNQPMISSFTPPGMSDGGGISMERDQSGQPQFNQGQGPRPGMEKFPGMQPRDRMAPRMPQIKTREETDKMFSDMGVQNPWANRGLGPSMPQGNRGMGGEQAGYGGGGGMQEMFRRMQQEQPMPEGYQPQTDNRPQPVYGPGSVMDQQLTQKMGRSFYDR